VSFHNEIKNFRVVIGNLSLAKIKNSNSYNTNIENKIPITKPLTIKRITRILDYIYILYINNRVTKNTY
jgi:hypothetical protein